MGTRNLTMVIDKQGETKVAQYGQWDGYPSGQGKNILKFLKAKARRTKLEKQLSKVSFFENTDPFVIGYNSRVDKDKRTKSDIKWFTEFISRDICGDILTNITNSKDKEIKLLDSGNEETSQWVEWAYKVDYKQNVLGVYFNIFDDPIKEYKLDELPSVVDFISELDKIANKE